MPIVKISMLQGRSEKQIKEVITQVSQVVAETLDISQDRVRVVVQEVPKTHWGIGGEVVANINMDV